LRYFGEENVEECGHCDVCLAGKEKPMNFENPTVKQILSLLSDKLPHRLREVASIDAPRGEIDRAVDFLMAEEKIKREVDKLLLQ
jgi:ATP-dependent DNA helicase RecQ